jgi:hypothetical protein
MYKPAGILEIPADWMMSKKSNFHFLERHPAVNFYN